MRADEREGGGTVPAQSCAQLERQRQRERVGGRERGRSLANQLMTRDAHFSINKVVCCFRWLALALALNLSPLLPRSPPAFRCVVLLCFAVNANVIRAVAAAEALSLQQTLQSPVKVDVS